CLESCRSRLMPLWYQANRPRRNRRSPLRIPFAGIAKMQYNRRMTWIVEVLDARVRDELEALPADMRARFRRIVELIHRHGLEAMREPHVKHLEGPLWEMRMKARTEFLGRFTSPSGDDVS